MTGLAGVVLAAGGASRFGAAKQVALLHGTTLVTLAARRALSCCPAGVVVVTGAFAEEVRAELADVPVRIAHNATWATGLAGSIRCGLHALPSDATAALLMLCDQPAVDAQALQSLATAWSHNPGSAAAARYAGTLGVPAIFPRSLWPALCGLSGDQGARALLASLSGVTEVPLPPAAHDVDTPEDLDVLDQRG